MTKYEIRNARRDGILIDFADQWRAEQYWRENIENCSATDSRKGSVMGRCTWESAGEAERARLDWLDKNRGIDLSVNMPIRDLIDAQRPNVQREFVQLLPPLNTELRNGDGIAAPKPDNVTNS